MRPFGPPPGPVGQVRGENSAANPSAPDARFEAPPVALPRGGGALRGIGETFAANPATGSATWSLPLPVSPGPPGATPQLALRYDSGAGNGPFGLGWSLDLPAITRRTDKKLPSYPDTLDPGRDDDTFLLAGAEELVPLPGSGVSTTVGGERYRVHRYRPRIDTAFSRIERWMHEASRTCHWVVSTGDNVTARFGPSAAQRVADPANPGRTASWLLAETVVPSGHVVRYEYAGEDGAAVLFGSVEEAHRSPGLVSAQRYLKRVRYGNRRSPLADPGWERAGWAFELVLDYDDHDREVPTPAPQRPWSVRPDPFSSYRAGFEVRTYRRCERALMFHHFPDEPAVGEGCLVRSLDLAYATQAGLSLLTSAWQSGYRREAQSYARASTPPVDFRYTPVDVEPRLREVENASGTLPAGAGRRDSQWIDLDGEGLPGLLQQVDGAWWYRSSLGEGRWSAPRVLGTSPVATSPEGRFLDVAGDSVLRFVSFDDHQPGFFKRTSAPDEEWLPFRTFSSLPSIDWDSPHVRLVDLDGDGRPDVLVTADEALSWYASLGEDGYAQARRLPWASGDKEGPRVVFAESFQTIFLADMSGDGLSDLVRIRNGDICYWPNLGFGRFGARVQMAAAPVFAPGDAFDPARLRLADVDGSGTTDLVYLGGDVTTLYRNQCGNAWSAPIALHATPPASDFDAVDVMDLLGNGTACIVWSGIAPAGARKPLAYLDLCGGSKPHLLTSGVNNLGAETRVHYAASTSFYLADRAAGRPWITRLPFPVQVVATVETLDHVTRTRLVTRFAYHHGFYDTHEREFRGFGMVEQSDSETFDVLAAGDGPALNEALDTHVPPVRTLSWFHTGAWTAGDTLRQRFDEEFYRGPLLPWSSPAVDADAAVPVVRDAHAALKGALLRQEVFSDDGTPAALHPYSVTEHAYAVRCVQPAGDGRRAVFTVHREQTVTCHYERNPDDPRLAQELVLAVDAFGNATEKVSIAHGRLREDESLNPADRHVQRQALAIYERHTFTRAQDTGAAYRTPVPCETRRYDASGAFFDQPARLFGPAEIRARLAASSALPLLAHSQTLFRRDDLSGDLPLGEVDALALPAVSRTLAWLPGQVEDVFGARVTPRMLEEAGYVADPEGSWWATSGRVRWSPEGADAAADELAFARDHFFVPHRFVDPYGGTTHVAYAYDLLPASVRDALGNVTTAVHDFRVLAPRLVIDPNGNGADAQFDLLGAVTGTAVHGKDGEGVGDDLQGFAPDLTPAAVEAFLADPLAHAGALLGRATARTVYDRDASRRHRHGVFTPVAAATIRRLTHVGDLPPGSASDVQIEFEYSNGTGRVIQRKVQAPPVGGGARWVGTGWVVSNNKGLPVRQFEPFFSSTHGFEFAREQGVAATTLYDAASRPVALVRADRAWVKTVVGAWSETAWDSCDTAAIDDPSADPDVGGLFARLPSALYTPTWHQARRDGALGAREQAGAEQSARHAGTPLRRYYDALGRPVVAIEHNRRHDAGDVIDEFAATRTTLDLEGRPLAVHDALGREVARYRYSLLGHRVFEGSIDAGDSWVLHDVTGGVACTWDAAGHRVATRVDALRRPIEVRLRQEVEVTVETMVYGESIADGSARNLRGRVVEVRDQAGIVDTLAYDFKGNPLTVRRRFWDQYRGLVAVDGTVAVGDAFDVSTAFDAMDRPVRQLSPDGSVTVPRYTGAGLLEGVDVQLPGSATAVPYVVQIEYDAKGQRRTVEYGNGVRTEHVVDPQALRLQALRSTRGGVVLQDLRYTYDAEANVTHVDDAAQAAVFFRNAVVDAHAEYAYDALYRLVASTGREHVGQLEAPATGWRDEARMGRAHPEDGQQLRRYREAYEYDLAGNLQRLIHEAAGGSWQRRFRYEAPSLRDEATHGNRLTRTETGGHTDTFAYDVRGNVRSLAHAPSLAWDFSNRLREVDLGGGGRACYVYDADGTRVRKVIEDQQGRRRSERFCAGVVEDYREYSPAGDETLRRESLHVLDGESRVALVERRVAGNDGTPATLVRFQLANHLGSATLELDGEGQLISYEEFHPYGSTALETVRGDLAPGAKRYRFTGKERDEETGLQDHGARYYAPWLARWISADPAGIADGLNLYVYVGCSPASHVDPDGRKKVKVNFIPPALKAAGGGPGTQWVYTPQSKDVILETDPSKFARQAAGAITFEYDPNSALTYDPAAPNGAEFVDELLTMESMLGALTADLDDKEYSGKTDTDSVWDKLARGLAEASGIVNLEFTEDEEKGKKYGSPMGGNPDGVNHPASQAASSVVMIAAAFVGFEGNAVRKTALQGADKALLRQQLKGFASLRTKIVKQLAKGSPLDGAAKGVLREEAKALWSLHHGLKLPKKHEVHHIIPLEYAHLFPDADPNDIRNLVAASQESHVLVHRFWTEFRNSNPAPTAAAVERAARDIADVLPAWKIRFQ